MTLSDTESRLSALERQNRIMRRVLGAALVAAGGFALLGMRGQEQPKDARYRIVYASKFAVQDPRTGKTRATLAHQTMAGGWAGLTL